WAAGGFLGLAAGFGLALLLLPRSAPSNGEVPSASPGTVPSVVQKQPEPKPLPPPSREKVAPSESALAPPEKKAHTLETQALEEIKGYGKIAGLNAVTLDPELTKGCLAHAQYLVKNAKDTSTHGLGAHNEDPKLPGYTDEGKKAGAAADIAWGDLDPLEAVDAWMATLFHRLPILDPALQKIGFGYAEGTEWRWVTVLDLHNGKGKPEKGQVVIYPVARQKDVPLTFP